MAQPPPPSSYYLATTRPYPGSSSLEQIRRRWASEHFPSSSKEELSGPDELEKRRSDEGDQELTEVAVPNPVDRNSRRRDSLERHESLAQRSSQGQSSYPRESGWNDAALTELAAPEPTDENWTPSSAETSGHHPDKQEGIDEVGGSLEKSHQSPHRRSRTQFVTELYTISWLILFSFLGTLARLGVIAINRYPNAPWSSNVLWANLGGSLFLGFLTEDRRIFREEWGRLNGDDWSFRPIDNETESIRAKQNSNHGKVKKTIPLFIGLATGFCGSFTSFSSFLRDAFLALTNDLASPQSGNYSPSTRPVHSRHGGYSFMATMAVIIVHPSISLAALKFGAHIALAFDPIMPTLPFRFIRRILDPLAVCLAFGCWLGAVLLTVFPPHQHYDWRPRATIALIFSPIGCLLRFYASRHLNARIPSFPMGTFLVNIFGTAVLGMCFDLQHTRIGQDFTKCGVLEGVMEGFCGCLTTVSTWVAELNGLQRRHAYVYGLTSVGVGLGALVIIMGGVGWTLGFATPACLDGRMA